MHIEYKMKPKSKSCRGHPPPKQIFCSLLSPSPLKGAARARDYGQDSPS